TIVVHALLDSESTTGAYRFTVRPGEETIVDVELTLYPRVVLDRIGLAPLTSMFLFNATNRNRIEDFRNAVHDSSGLQIHNGRGEWIWRPLTNPLELQVSDFADASPHGFGLIQRTRAFTDFEDLEARYERRPSVWIEPIGDWGDGVVRLVEIPSFRETDDNIVAFWRPSRPIAAGAAFSTSYRMHWGVGPEAPQGLATVKATRVGRSFDQQRILVVVDFVGGPSAPDGIELDVSGSSIEVVHPVLQANPETGGLRASFEFSPVDVAMTELRMQLRNATGNASEVWLFRWTEQS
ncbi:MAG: glucan biosynthesis protein, partial [Hyphomicrobiales bacterium]